MKKNMGNADKVIRVFVAVVITVLYLTGIVKGTLGLVLLIVALIFLITSLFGFCPIYFPFKLSTKKESNPK